MESVETTTVDHSDQIYTAGQWQLAWRKFKQNKLALYSGGLTTQEVAALLESGAEGPDRVAAERALITMVGDGRATRVALGNDALWIARSD